MSRINRTISAARNGITPRKIVVIETSSRTRLFITKTFMPIGGVIMPISTSANVTIPHQIRSRSIARMIGMTNGTVTTRAATVSNTLPSTRYMMTRMLRISQAGMVAGSMIDRIAVVTPARFR